MPSGIAGPNIQLRTRASAAGSPDFLAKRLANEAPSTSPPQPFEGDLAIKRLRRQLSLDKQLVPAPPLLDRPKTGRRGRAAISVTAGLAAVTAFGIAFAMQRQALWPDAPMQREVALQSPPPLNAMKEDQATEVISSHRVGPQLAAVSGSMVPAPRLVIKDRQAFANDALLLDIALEGGTGGEFAVLNGLADGIRIAAGRPYGANGWRLSTRELAQALAYAPKDFVGAIEVTIRLHSDNDVIVDTRPIRLTWIPKPPEFPASERQPESAIPVQDSTSVTLDISEVATLLRRGQEYLRTGDIAAARLVLRRAANANDFQATLALGSTFDPVVLAELGVLGFLPDANQARMWYEKAARLGSLEASTRIERLARTRN
jgi:hypothetical protein